MNQSGVTDRIDLASVSGVTLGGAQALVNAVRFVLYSVLALLEPAILFVLTLAAVVLCALCGFYSLVNLAHPTHFPFAITFGWIAACGVTAAGYYALLYWLEPRASYPRQPSR